MNKSLKGRKKLSTKSLTNSPTSKLSKFSPISLKKNRQKFTAKNRKSDKSPTIKKLKPWKKSNISEIEKTSKKNRQKFTSNNRKTVKYAQVIKLKSLNKANESEISEYAKNMNEEDGKENCEKIKPIKLTPWREENWNDDEEAESGQRKKRNTVLIILGVTIGIVLFSTILSILFALYNKDDPTMNFANETSTEKTKTPISIRDTNLTDLCQKINRGYYFKGKYVQNCQFEFCDSLKFQPLIPVANDSHPLEFKLYIREPSKNSEYQIVIPEWTLCKIESYYGFCLNQKCVKDEKITDLDVEAIQPINGGWSKTSSWTDGIENSTIINERTTEIWKKLTNRVACGTRSNCRRTLRTYEFRTCNNPAPARGGKLCWENTTGYVQWYEWPLRFNGLCKNCNDTYKNKFCNETGKEVNCFIDPSHILNSDNMYCCSPRIKLQPGKSHPGYGLCIAQFCLPVNIV